MVKAKNNTKPTIGIKNPNNPHNTDNPLPFRLLPQLLQYLLPVSISALHLLHFIKSLLNRL